MYQLAHSLKGVTNVINVLPFSQATALLREPFTQQSVETLTPHSTEAVTKVSEFYGISLKVGNYTLDPIMLDVTMAGIFILFTAAAIWRMNRRLKVNLDRLMCYLQHNP